MGRIEKVLCPAILTYSCACHSMNLLAQDLLNSNTYQDVINEVTHIAKVVKYSQFISSTLKVQSSGKKCAIQLPCKTRWMSMFDCVDSLLLSKKALKVVAATNEDSRIDKDTCQTLLSDKLWTSVANIHSILLPLKISLKFLEANSAGSFHIK